MGAGPAHAGHAPGRLLAGPSSRSRRRLPITLAVAVAIACAVAGASGASTGVPLTWATACADALAVANCQRLTWIANRLDEPAAAAEPVSGTVALDADASSRLDLVWWGSWALVGLGLVAVIAPAWRSAFPWGSSGGDV